jgi:hypothetical protein
MPHSKQKQDIKKKWDELGFLEGLKNLHKAESKKRNTTSLERQVNDRMIFQALPIAFIDRDIKEGEAIEDEILFIGRITKLLHDIPSSDKYGDIINKQDLYDIKMVVSEWYVKMLHKNSEL